ncbi:methyltransferase family protein [Singulisphaera rosea]
MNDTRVTTESRGPIQAVSPPIVGASATRQGTTGLRVGAIIDLHKALVIPIVAAMMSYYRNGSTDAFVYLGMHGSYSLLWLIKQQTYRDVRFDRRVNPPFGLLFIFLPLAGYYVAPYLLISRHISAPPALIGLAVFVFTFGVFLHFVSDAQKYYTLQLRKGLIRDGLYSRMRNPNYLGEILIYLAYATLSMHWLPFLIIAGWVFGFFASNMLAKDRSLARHPGFEDYRKSSGLLFPKVF